MIVLLPSRDLLEEAVIAALLKPIFTERADACLGITSEAGIRFVTCVTNFLNGTKFGDALTQTRAYRASTLRTVPLRADGPEIYAELTAKGCRNRFRTEEVQIAKRARAAGDSSSPNRVLPALWTVLRSRFTSDYADAGKVTLDALECAPRFNQWMYESVRPWLGRRVAELGAGKGNLSDFFRRHENVLLTDYREDYLDGLRRRFAETPALQYAKLDMTQSGDYEALRPFDPDTVVFLNVLEHIENDELVLRRLHEVLSPASRVIVLVPYNMRLYSEFDRELGHFRRYGKGELEGKLQAAGFRLVRQRFFNKVGVLAWYVANTLGGRRALTPTQLKVYNFLTPLFQTLEPFLPISGLSTIVVAEKT